MSLVRITVLFISGLALLLAILGRRDILTLLTGAYSIYTPGVIFPLMVAIFANGKYGVRKEVWLAAVIAGGLCGIAGSYFSEVLLKSGVPEVIMNYLTLIGMGISFVLSIVAVNFRNPKNE